VALHLATSDLLCRMYGVPYESNLLEHPHEPPKGTRAGNLCGIVAA
jgi:hypothetical protein